jgi:lysophospholipase L1-like esterase
MLWSTIVFMHQKLTALIAVAVLVVPIVGLGFPGPEQWGLPSAGVWGFPSGVSFGSGSNGKATSSSAAAPQHTLHSHLIVCVGDSITEGFTDPNNWPYHLKTRLGGDWEVINQGVGGAKTGDMLGRIDQALALNPHFVIILGGTNDLANGDVLLPTTQANINTMCARVEAYGAVPVLCTVIPNSYNLTQRDILNVWLTEYASLKGFPLIDFYSVIDNPVTPGHSNPALVMSDGVHPNSAGYAAMGNAVDLGIFTGVSQHS